MPMRPNEIKAEMVRAGVTQVSIARQSGYSAAYVGDIIAGNRRNAGIERLIAHSIEREPHDVFEPREAREAAVA